MPTGFKKPSNGISGIEANIKRVAFTFIGHGVWTGGYHYLLNLLHAVCEHAADRVVPVLFVSTHVDEDLLSPIRKMPRVELVRDSAFDAVHERKRFMHAILTGKDIEAARVFASHRIDVVFEAATFYGWRFPFDTIAWLADFQHRRLRSLFGFGAFWKREIGFQVQINFRRKIMVSSGDAQADCEHFYPRARGRVTPVRFAVPVHPESFDTDPAAVIKHYGLPDAFFFLPNQFWKHKNHRLVIEALRVLRARGHSVVVAASGQPVDPRHPRHYSELQGSVAEYGLEQEFRFLGMIPRGHLIALMRACTALINPSRFEGWSTTVEEAKSLGVPLLLSSLPVHKEQAGPNANYFDADSPEQLATLLVSGGSGVLRRESETRALESMRERVARFGKDFAALVERRDV